MANWREFEGEYVWTPQAGGFKKQVLQTHTVRDLQDGEEVVLYEKRGGVLKRKVDSRILVKILDDHRALLKVQRPHEPVVNAGLVQDSKGGEFGFATERYEWIRDKEDRMVGSIVEGVKSITKQDVWLEVGRRRIRGVMWTNNGVRVAPECITNGRSYYSEDTDEETKKILSEVYHSGQEVTE